MRPQTSIDMYFADWFAAWARLAQLRTPTIAAFETALTEVAHFERRLFHAVFATADQKEGMGALIDKRAPEFNPR